MKQIAQPTAARRLRAVALAGLAGLTVLASACGGGASSNQAPAGSAATRAAPPGSSDSAASPAAVAPAASPAAAVPPAASPAVAGSPAAVQKVNANTASQAEVQRALEAAGVPNAARWAVEVVEYRPYPTDDPNLGKLRQNLVKYNPAPGVVDQIVSALTP